MLSYHDSSLVSDNSIGDQDRYLFIHLIDF